jgi:outer membrane biosynthesis protein TonB
LKALAKKPEERFATAEEMRDRLAGIGTRFPWAPEDLDAVLVKPRDLDATAVLPRRGSTQERLDRQFQKVETPVVGTVPMVAVVAPHPLAPSPTPSLPPGEGGRSAEEAERMESIPKEPRRRNRLPVWLAAVAAVLVLALLMGFFLRREETVEVAAAVPAEEKVAGAADVAETLRPAPAVAVEPVATPPEPEPAPAFVRPAPAPVIEEPAKKTPPAPPVRQAEPEVKPGLRAPDLAPDRAPAAPAPKPKPKPERPRRSFEDEEEITFVEPPRAVSVPNAPYPEEVIGSGAKGRVVVSIRVNEKGEVSDAKISSILIENGGQPAAGVDVKALFRDAALAAARRARFAPAESDGVAVPYSGGELTYSFKP